MYTHMCTHMHIYMHTYTVMHMYTCKYTHSNCSRHCESSVLLSGEPHRYYSLNLNDLLPSMCMDPGQG